MINHAVQNGVKYIVVVGSFTVKDPIKMSHIASRFVSSELLLEKLGVEKGLKWTVLRGSYFMENLLNPNFKNQVKSGTITLAKSYAPMVDTRDIGRSAAVCLAATNDPSKYHAKKYEMNRPEVLTGEDVARITGKVLGKQLNYVELPREMISKIMPEAIAQTYEYVVDNGKEAIPFTQDVQNLTGQNINFEKFLIDHKSYFD
jgi:uncharacterized protein YbjT (DUF2867 family)